MDNKIKQNLVYLADNLTNLDRILLYLMQNDIISRNERDQIRREDTAFNKNSELLDVIQRKNLPIEVFLNILRKTQNEYCANKIEGILPADRKLENPKLLKNVWWPDKKVLIKSLHKRNIGNKLLIEELHEKISRDEKRMVVICESADASKLTGMGGLGKTVTATWYAHNFENEYDHVIWLDAGEDSLLTSFKKLARDLDVRHLDKLLDLEDFSRKAYEALEEFKCLWIFDNTERYRGKDGIQKILPVEKTEFYCLITSRSMDWGIANGYGQISRLELDIFGEEEAVLFFRVNLNEKVQYTESKLKELCRLLGYLPLAMQLAIAALNTGKIDLKNYIEKTATADLDKIVDVEFDGYEKTINKSIKITMELIREKKGTGAYDILLICGYIRPDAIPKEFFKAVLNIDDEKFNSAISLLTEYSLIGQETKIINEKKQQVFNIHRLLQQVIRHNGRKTEKYTLRKIFNCNGFVEYKLIPFTKYANEELRKEFPKIKAELLDQRQLLKLVKEEKFADSVELAKFIHKEITTNTTKFNYAICLGKNGQLEDEMTVLEELRNQDIKIEQIEYYNIFDFPVGWTTAEMGLLNLYVEVSQSLVFGHLLVSGWKMDNKERIQEMLEERPIIQFIESQEMMSTLLRILNVINSNYSLTNAWSLFKLTLGGETKRIRLGNCSFDMSVPFPNDLEELVLMSDVLFTDGNGKHQNCPDVSEWLPKKLNTLDICCCQESQIFLSLKCISSIENISLSNCTLSLDSVNRISPRQLNLRSVSFVKNGHELSNPKINEFVDFHKMNRLELFCCRNSLSIDLSDESANIEYLHLWNVTTLSLKSANGRVNIKEANIWNCLLDLSILPSSLEKLSVSFGTQVLVSGGIELPNLKYLKLERMKFFISTNNILPHFRSLQLTHLYLRNVYELNVDLLPPSIKLIKIDTDYIRAIILQGGVIHLDNLVMCKFYLSEVEEMLCHFHPKQLALFHRYEPRDLTKLMGKQIPIIAIGRVNWGNVVFHNSLLSKQVDRQSKFYLLNEGTGKTIEEKDFDELYLLKGVFES